MTSHWKESLHRWLAAERSRHGAAADSALYEVFRLLADPQAAPGFATAVVRGLEGRPVPSSVSPPLRWAIAAAMIAAALSVAVLPLVLAPLPLLARAGALVELTGTALVAASRALASWLGFWQSLAQINAIVSNLVSRPQAALLLLGILAISVVGLKLFASLMTSDRSTRYA